MYSYLGNQSATVSDPYAEIKCGVCSNRSDEEFLLLCDLCDSAWHTYCVGLGAVVPEGDWYCSDCALIRTQHSMFESVSVGCNRDSYDRLRSVRSSQVSTNSFETEIQIRGENYVRTLGIFRNLQDRIQQIRENWNSIQSGSLGFPLNSNLEDTNIGRKNCEYSMVSDDLDQEEAARNAKQNEMRRSDVKKAWKMFGKVKSREGSQNLQKNSKLDNACMDVSSVSMNISNNCEAIKKPSANPVREHTSFYACRGEKSEHVHNLQECDITGKLTKFSESRNAPMDISNHCKASTKHSVSPIGEHITFPGRTEKTSKHAKDVHAHECDIYRKKLNRINNMTEKLIRHKEINAGSGRSCNKSYSTRNEGRSCSIKDEVRSLVKLNLKLESKGQKLNSNKFREIARASTHTILAACGIEHSKSCARRVFVPKCKHYGQCGEQSKYSLMSNSCRKCFFSFVKHVVSTISLEMHGQ